MPRTINMRRGVIQVYIQANGVFWEAFSRSDFSVGSGIVDTIAYARTMGAIALWRDQIIPF